jgi:hypothetical protein
MTGFVREFQMKFNIAVGLLAVSLALSAAAAGADTYIRPGKDGPQEINVVIQEGQLFCTRVSDGFEMCNGMTENEDHTWTGPNMRHPDMPEFMKFRGTVSFTGNGLTIKGCALVFCDSENWTKG